MKRKNFVLTIVCGMLLGALAVLLSIPGAAAQDPSRGVKPRNKTILRTVFATPRGNGKEDITYIDGQLIDFAKGHDLGPYHVTKVRDVVSWGGDSEHMVMRLTRRLTIELKN